MGFGPRDCNWGRRYMHRARMDLHDARVMLQELGNPQRICGLPLLPRSAGLE